LDTATEHATVVDFHGHFAHRDLPLVPPPGFPRELVEQLELQARLWDDLDAQIEALDATGVDVRVLSAPPSNFVPFEHPPPAAVRRVNERLADWTAAHPTRLVGLASVDAFAGDAGAEEARRAIEELGLGGLVVDSELHGAFIGSAETLPTLAAAADLGVPVLVHPTTPKASTLFESIGLAGIAQARAVTNSASLLSLLQRETLQRIPGLRVVFTMLGAAGLLQAGILGLEHSPQTVGERGAGGIYIDTMRLDVRSIRYVVDVLGVDRVLFGTDWPAAQPAITRTEIHEALTATGLSAEEQWRITAANALVLLDRSIGAP
jgi:predicted TIM-barrel fold metal-dependent hydrolase